MEQDLPTLPEHLSSPPGFSGFRGTLSWVLCIMFCRSLFVLLSFFCWSLCYLSFFVVWILITPLVSSNSSWWFIVFAPFLLLICILSFCNTCSCQQRFSEIIGPMILGFSMMIDPCILFCMKVWNFALELFWYILRGLNSWGLYYIESEEDICFLQEFVLVQL